jgi:hypothetical protein
VGGGVTPAVTDSREREEEEFGEEGADGWGRLVGGRESGIGYRFGSWPGGPWAGSSDGPKSFPAAFSYFLFFFLFSFSVFLFLL